MASSENLTSIVKQAKTPAFGNSIAGFAYRLAKQIQASPIKKEPITVIPFLPWEKLTNGSQENGKL